VRSNLIKLNANSVDPDQIAQMFWLVWIYTQDISCLSWCKRLNQTTRYIDKSDTEKKNCGDTLVFLGIKVSG
jgi:hypothetical protein